MYYEIEYGWGVDPDKHIKLIKSDYFRARQTMRNIFRSYQMQLEGGVHLENFTCILKQKGTDQGNKEETPKEKRKEKHKESTKKKKPEEENYHAKWGIFV